MLGHAFLVDFPYVRPLKRGCLLLAIFLGAMVLSACSDRSQTPEDLVHRVLPKLSEIPGDWNSRAFEGLAEQSGRPGELADSAACEEADRLFGEHEGRRDLTGVGFASRELPGTYLYFFAESAQSEWWTPTYPESIAAYYSSDAWGRCYADWLEDNQKSPGASVVQEQVTASAAAPSNGASVAWNYHLDGKSADLRVEVYVWTEGPLMLLVQSFTSANDLDPEFTATVLSMYRDKAAKLLEEER